MLNCARFARLALLFCVLTAHTALCGEIPLRVELPEGSAAEGSGAIPVNGGIPFPKGAIKSVAEVRLVDSGGKEIPCQATQMAVWPDGSIKWAMIDAVIAAPAELKLEYGPDIKRQAIAQRVSANKAGDDVKITGGGMDAAIRKNGSGFIDAFALTNGKEWWPIIKSAHPSRLAVDALRIPEGTSGTALPVNTFVCRDPKATIDAGKVEIDELAIESPGPIRATVRIRGHVLLPHLGETLPAEIKQREPAGKLPFSMRVSFFANTAIVFGQTQIIYTGEPDCDYIAHWGIELPGQSGETGRLIVEPGIALTQSATELATFIRTTLSADHSRLCFAPIKNGYALIRRGWENRPAGITIEGTSAWIDFWPKQAGLFDLRRYAREWAVGETGNVKNPGDIERYAKLAARGIAKSHDFVIDFGANPEKEPAKIKQLADRALLVAPPAWYAASGALGHFAPEQTSGDFAPIDTAIRRQLDYRLFSQDLFNWYGKLTYGFWQYRYGEMHRTDRWENDYGRWAWSLADGAGRIGHILMLEYLRTLDRRYFDAGAAFSRISFDTNMVHTQQHYENAGTGFWTIPGCCHRHNVQPFGCPYVGMRGSYPDGQRILYFLTGDGVIADGLELVASAALASSKGQESRQGNSGDDGLGPAATAMLWKYETTGDKSYLTACRTLLDRAEVFPPKNFESMGYAPSFGIFTAAQEYAEISGDAEFQKRCADTAQAAMKRIDEIKAKKKTDGDAKGAENFFIPELLRPIATGYVYSKDEALKTLVETRLKKIAQQDHNGIEFIPPEQWPGHTGASTPSLDANGFRDWVYVMSLLVKTDANAGLPKPTPAIKALPAAAPGDWYRATDLQPAAKFPDANTLLTETSKGPAKDPPSASHLGECKGSIFVDVVGAANEKDNKRHITVWDQAHTDVSGDLFHGKAGPADIVLKIPSLLHFEAALKIPKDAGHIASWGLVLPLELSKDAHHIETTAPGRFRLERCRLDQNDERIPSWLTSEERLGKDLPLWPKWRISGAQFGPGDGYRLWRATGEDVVPVICDQGEGAPFWFDITDRGANPRWGLTVRLLKPEGNKPVQQSVRVNLETGMLEIQFHDAAAAPLDDTAAAGAVDLIFHDGWRPPLSKPELSAAQYEKFIDDLGYGENYGLFALRFNLSATHKVQGREWMEKIRDLGIEPREILYSMQYNNALAEHCKKLGVAYKTDDLEGSVKAVIEHYKK